MKSLPAFLIAGLNIITICDAIILTRFKNIQNYAVNLLEKTTFVSDELKDEHYPVKFCRKLLEAPVVELYSDYTKKFTRRQDTGVGEIDRKQWNALLFERPQKKNFQILDKNFTLWAHTCVAHDSSHSWQVVYDYEQATGILFSTKTNPPSVYALIETSRTLKNLSNRNPISYFKTSLEIQNERGFGELLCKFFFITKFRLCSIAADSLHRSKTLHSNSSQESLGSEIMNGFRDSKWIKDLDPHFNFIYPHSISSCPTIKIKIEDGTKTAYVVGEALYCHVSMYETIYHFYLKNNKNEESVKSHNIFVIETDENEIILRGDIKLLQFNNIFNMNTNLLSS